MIPCYACSVEKCLISKRKALYILGCEDGKPRTKGDWVRSMSDEELARYFDNMQGLAYINGFDSEPIRLYPNNYGAWLDWLKQGVDNG